MAKSMKADEIKSLIAELEDAVSLKVEWSYEYGLYKHILKVLNDSVEATYTTDKTSMTANQMLESVRASLREWPNGACDTEIGKEVTRIIKEASGTEATPTKRIIVTHPSQMSAEALDAGAIGEYVDVPVQAAASPVEHFKRLLHLTPLSEGDYWTWQGDGEDHLESLVGSCRILITAAALRELLRQSAAPSGGAALVSKLRDLPVHKIGASNSSWDDVEPTEYVRLSDLNATLPKESKTGAVTGAGERPVTPNSASRIGSTERGPGIPESGETGADKETK